ncbi:hypothetical protein Btru_031238 [Bulinus truncatus]|nr:hypothetical protein Btru_031238 [Bulinus truncatus]
MDVTSLQSNFYGTHETESSEGGEGDLRSLYDTCTKNPGHAQFISINDLSVGHLPVSYQDPEICDYVKAVADLTVRVSLNQTSPDRPEFWQDTELPYPFFEMRGKSTLRTGSGMVRRVTRHSGSDKFPETCKCKVCASSKTPSEVWVELDVFTATHVVFNAQEAESAVLKFLYDDYDGHRVLTFDDVRFVRSDVAEDLSWLKCVTCEKSRVDWLCDVWERFVSKRGSICGKYEGARDAEGGLTFIVSHPHGCPKKVTFGQWKERVRVGDRLTKYTYDTATCNGSSGSSVNILGYNTGRWFYRQHVHSGVFKETNTNYSSTGLD